jgi:flagellar biosynthesis protein FlhG
MADLDEAAGEFDGERLRRVRLQRGLELEEIAKVTKVNPTYLRFIEEERFDELPAAVYVRGFVVGYASCVGLEGKRVAKSYMTRFEESRDNPKRRLFSRR